MNFYPEGGIALLCLQQTIKCYGKRISSSCPISLMTLITLPSHACSIAAVDRQGIVARHGVGRLRCQASACCGGTSRDCVRISRQPHEEGRVNGRPTHRVSSSGVLCSSKTSSGATTSHQCARTSRLAHKDGRVNGGPTHRNSSSNIKCWVSRGVESAAAQREGP